MDNFNYICDEFNFIEFDDDQIQEEVKIDK
ncbi:hypothetical protein ABID96_002110 [Bacillus sp. OAE603]